MKQVILKIDGMSCSACQNRVEKYLNKQDGVSASVNLVMAQAFIEYDEEKVSLSDIERFISESGYKSLGIYNEKEEEKVDNTKYYLVIFGILILFIFYISMANMFHFPIVSLLDMEKNLVSYGVTLFIITIPFLVYGFDIMKRGIKNIFHRSPNMDSLVTIGVLASFIYSVIELVLVILGDNGIHHFYFESSAMIIYFIKLGRFIDKNSKEKTKEAIKELVQITPQTALIKSKNSVREITIDEVKKGDILVCKAGMKFAVDGVITKGTAHIDESFITGESIPSKKEVNNSVVAGSINMDGYIEYKAKKIGPESTISEIVRLVMQSIHTKAPMSRFADTISGYFVPGIILIAVITFLIYLVLGYNFNESIISFVTVLVIACPCALGLATPLAVVVSVGESVKRGILIKSSEILENAYKVDTIIFDKTGTLTYGTPKISKIINYSKLSDKEIFKIVSILEHNSAHPIATAFIKYYDKNINVDKFETINGMGISGIINKNKYYVGNSKLLKKLNIDNKSTEEEKLSQEGNSILYVVKNKEILSLIGVNDITRTNAKDTIKDLIKLNKNVIMLSGDNEPTANIIAKELGIKNVIANVMPKEKKETLSKLKAEGHKVMMVGDGINDAPSLANSDIGVSLSGATDIAGDSADIILIQDDLSKIVTLFDISKRTIKIIKENLFWAFIYNILMIPIAIGLLKPLGIMISPMVASIAMTISSLTVVLNSLRLKKVGRKNV